MARRRKTEGKTVAKFGEKTVAVRKSSRQIAKKHETGQICNGELDCSSKLNDSEESGGSQDDQNQREDKINDEAAVHKKFGKYRCLINDVTGTNTSVIIERCKRDTEESDSQDGMESRSISSVKFSPEDVRQMVVGGLALPNETPDISNMIQSELPTRSTTSEGLTEIVWREDVIEETIICEDMEVKEDAINDSYTINQDGSIVVKEVLLVNNQEFESDRVVELTILERNDSTKSMAVTQNINNSSPADKTNQEENLYQNREKAVSKMCMTECNGKKPLTTNPDLQEMELIKNEIQPHDSDPEIRKVFKEKIKPKICELSVNKRYANFKKNRSRISVPQTGFDQSVNFNTAVKSSEKIGYEMQIHASCTESSEFVSKDLNWVTLNSYPTTTNYNPLMKKCADVMTQRNIIAAIHSTDNEVRPFFKSIDRLQAKIGGGQESRRCIVVKEKTHNPTNVTDVQGITMRTVESSTVNTETYENGVDVEYSMDVLGLNNESEITNERPVDESSGDSETYLKADTEDVKICSSSENSNDMLLSSRSYKLPEFTDTKNISNQPNELEKKIGFRSRSGSTDTTGSESGSNSSGVRRSSRIRTIGLMKQRCRGRGLVTKPNFDLSKTIFQHDRDKLSFAQEPKDNSDNQSETQSDRENSNNKTPLVDIMVPASLILGTPGYESDTSKPVKVKSRWRRSSELEMGGNGSHKLLTTLEADTVGDGPSSRIGSPCNEASLQSVCKLIGSKTTLLSIPEDDKEMKERLSQFEHLKENLYLTERYTNKETKRMVCDCFLTKEEINRGELGCGEDCLNRLLMIECGARCVVGERCTNKRFQQCEYAKCEVFRTEKKGFGLRAMADLPAGEFLMEYVGEVVDPKDFRRRAKDYSKDKNRHYYFMALKSDQIIDATMKGNVSRFINHSCDPNSETQKWTVNGELRIGFFNKQFIAAGEEITFDYHFQRYGKEAQKCFCEAENCRGWIGETPEEEKEKSDKKEKQEKDTLKKKKEEKKVHDYIEDEDLEEEIEKLCLGGLKNRAHTLTLSRLMVRSREIEHRTRLLCLIQSGEQPCRRLFLDYHGLRLIWSYMMDVAENDTNKAHQFRLEILKTLRKLPIPNKTMLKDSKVFSVIEKWATKELNSSPSSGSTDDEHTRINVKIEDHVKSCDVDTNNSLAVTTGESAMATIDFKQEMDNETRNAEELTIFTELAKSLLCSWSSLKEVFRIPKKERIEQMKEHEREADRGYKKDLEKEVQRDKSYDRSYRSDRYGRSEGEKRLDRRRGRESPEFEFNRSKDKRVEERTNLVPIPRMSKFERRQLFAMQVAKEEQERQRRQQQGTWQEHEARCLALGMDPHTSAALDPQTGYSLFFNPTLNQWQTYPVITDSGDLNPQCPVYLSGTQTITSHAQSGLIASNTHMLPTSIFTQSQRGTFNHVNPTYSAILGPHHDQFANGQFGVTGENLIPIQNGSTQLVRDRSPIVYTEKLTEQSIENNATSEEGVPRLPSSQHLGLPLEWRYAKDERGRTYYYNVIDRVSQWLPPPPDHIPGQVETSSSSESSEESSSSDEDDEEVDEEEIDDDQRLDDTNSLISINEIMENSHVPLKTILTEKSDVSEEIFVSLVESKKRRDGLVQERIISPRREEERVDHKKYKEIKYKLRRQKEKAKLKEHVDKLKKHRKSSKSKSHAKQILTSKIQTNTVDISSSLERRIKDTFRINMANVMVHFLNPYRKNDCKQGRITNTDDFKHLARKLTHFVLAKELKHCKSVDELQCNENVKHKAKDFVRKYMSKFGAIYQKASDED